MQSYIRKTLSFPLQASKPDELVPSSTSIKAPSHFDFDVKEDKIRTSSVNGDVMKEKPKQTGVTVKISSNRNLNVQVQKLKLNEKIVIKVTL